MEVVEVKGFEIQGLILRTRNEIEMNPETANIPKHVEYVDSNLVLIISLEPEHIVFTAITSQTSMAALTY
ncbi:hypothetical protein [Vibrio parahaemolyticus]|uniref:hypothetical protein n=1 Tax=Vibrio parahaemolyticus TaxID=670 RepID=UPI001FAE4924|nr:hypothetical protein [Vibrio parahaemolyticus]MCZ6395389.1 hypothetical protein [Vibrio parahaemolyticus]MDZ5121313.1 hypothetical protein [Vibrio parahaemolyticus]